MKPRSKKQSSNLWLLIVKRWTRITGASHRCSSKGLNFTQRSPRYDVFSISRSSPYWPPISDLKKRCKAKSPRIFSRTRMGWRIQTSTSWRKWTRCWMGILWNIGRKSKKLKSDVDINKFNILSEWWFQERDSTLLTPAKVSKPF